MLGGAGGSSESRSPVLGSVLRMNQSIKSVLQGGVSPSPTCAGGSPAAPPSTGGVAGVLLASSSVTAARPVTRRRIGPRLTLDLGELLADALLEQEPARGREGPAARPARGVSRPAAGPDASR